MGNLEMKELEDVYVIRTTIIGLMKPSAAYSFYRHAFDEIFSEPLMCCHLAPSRWWRQMISRLSTTKAIFNHTLNIAE